MGALWQRIENTDFNQQLDKAFACVSQSQPFDAALEQARAVAQKQGLQQTVVQLTRLQKDKKDKDKDALLRALHSIRRSAQVGEVGFGEVVLDKPILVYLSGFLTTNNRNDYVIGSMKRVEDLIRPRGEIAEQPIIYGWTHSGLSNLFNLAAYNTRPNSRSSQAGYDLARHIILPRVLDAAGKPLEAQTAQKNLKNVTFFGYSAGTVVAQETFNASLELMQKAGFGKDEARSILSHVTLLSVGSISRASKETKRFTTVTLVATNDRITRMKNWLWGTWGTLMRKLNKLRPQGASIDRRELVVRPLSDTSLFISAAVRGSLYEWQYDEQGQRKTKRWFDPLFPKWTMARSYHELPHFITTDNTNNPFSHIALYTLVNAFNRQGRIAPEKLILPPENDTHSALEQAVYRERIEAARAPAPKTLQKSST